MSITVITNEFGSVNLEANDWEVDDGRLWVGSSSVGVAEFSAGSWSYVYEAGSKTEPVIVDSVPDEPDVVWEDNDGDSLKLSGGIWYRKYGNDLHWQSLDAADVEPAWFDYAPYTEVVGAK